jgi:hypothetical protein
MTESASAGASTTKGVSTRVPINRGIFFKHDSRSYKMMTRLSSSLGPSSRPCGKGKTDLELVLQEIGGLRPGSGVMPSKSG